MQWKVTDSSYQIRMSFGGGYERGSKKKSKFINKQANKQVNRVHPRSYPAKTRSVVPMEMVNSSGWLPGSTISGNNNHRKANVVQAFSPRSRAARCSLNLLREAEVFD
jgi:hypothetical protein